MAGNKNGRERTANVLEGNCPVGRKAGRGKGGTENDGMALGGIWGVSLSGGSEKRKMMKKRWVKIAVIALAVVLIASFAASVFFIGG